MSRRRAAGVAAGVAMGFALGATLTLAITTERWIPSSRRTAARNPSGMPPDVQTRKAWGSSGSV